MKFLSVALIALFVSNAHAGDLIRRLELAVISVVDSATVVTSLPSYSLAGSSVSSSAAAMNYKEIALEAQDDANRALATDGEKISDELVAALVVLRDEQGMSTEGAFQFILEAKID